MSASTKNLKVGDVFLIPKFPDSAYVVIKDTNDGKKKLFNMGSLSVCNNDTVDHFLEFNRAVKIGKVSKLWAKK